MENNNPILERIAKLLKMSESAKKIDSPHEAEVFAAKANALLIEHNLDISQVNMSDGEEDKFVKWQYAEEISYKDNQSGDRWRRAIISILCEYNMCNFTYNTYSKTFRIYGHMSNVGVVIWLYHFTSNAFLRMAQKAHVTMNPTYQLVYGTRRYAFLKDWLNGAVAGLDIKLHKERIRQQQHNIKTQAMMLYNDKALVEYHDQHINAKTGKKKKVITVGPAYSKGFEYGENYQTVSILK